MLELRGLRTHFATPRGEVRAVDSASFAIGRGRITALVGESGCGKSVTALSILRLLPDRARCAGGEIRFDGRDLLGLSEPAMRSIRGRRIGMVFQEPMSALHPLMTIGRQVAESLETHAGLSRRQAERRAVECLAQAALPDPARAAASHPHELSGGMRQRAMIALALAPRPELLIADEPTTALDATIQSQILRWLRDESRRRGLSMLLITHDLGVVAAVSDDVVVMYAGQVVEQGPTQDVLARPRHPYTRALLRCSPRLRGGRETLYVVPGAVPEPGAFPSGCRFHPRCELGAGEARCRTEPQAPRAMSPGHFAACWKTQPMEF